MELCKETLKDYIFKRNNEKDLQKQIEERLYTFNPINYFKNLNIFLAITKALKYLHIKQNIIHRDLKPENIFFSFEDQIKIGDFGLATDFYNDKYYNQSYKKNSNTVKDLRRNSTESNFTDFDNNNSNPSSTDKNTIFYHTKNIGTLLYASPEQLNLNFYDYKSDIYSLGFIFYELIVPFRTSMERKVKFQLLKEGQIDELIKENNSKISDLLIKMTDSEPNKRPNTEHIIEIIKEEITQLKINNFDIKLEQEFGNRKRLNSNSFTDSNNYSSNNSEVTEESSSLLNNNYNRNSSLCFQDDFSKISKEQNTKPNLFSNLIHFSNDSFHFIANYLNLESKCRNDVLSNDCICGKISNEKFKEKRNIEKEDFIVKNSADILDKNYNNSNLLENQKKLRTGFNHQEILINNGIYIQICFYEGDCISSTDVKNSNSLSYKDYMNSIHIKKFLKIVNNKLMIFNDEKSRKADKVYDIDECEILNDDDYENENKPDYQIFIMHPYLKNMSLYFNSYTEYFNFLEFFSNNES